VKIIEGYVPPSPQALAELKRRLGYTSYDMSKLAALSQPGTWRKYTMRTPDRRLNVGLHFYLAALLTLPEEQIQKVFEVMCQQGAELDIADFEPKANRREPDSDKVEGKCLGNQEGYQ
jgi:hypothetical protein